MLTSEQANALRDLALDQISIPLNSSTDRVEIARRAVVSTIQLLAPLVQMVPPAAPAEKKGPEQPAPAPEKPQG